MIAFWRKEKYHAFTYTRIGENHVLSRQENQDNVAFEQLGDAWYMVIADGVSSAACAKKGAQAAVCIIRQLCKRLSSDRHLAKNIDAIKVDIVRSWKMQVGSDWDKYATTVNFVIYTEQLFLVGQIGDGLIVADVDGIPLIMTDQEDFYSTETHALSAVVKKSAFTIKAIEANNKIRVYMASDGIGKEINEESRIELMEYLDRMMRNDDSDIEDELDTWVIGLNEKNGDDKSIGYISWEE